MHGSQHHLGGDFKVEEVGDELGLLLIVAHLVQGAQPFVHKVALRDELEVVGAQLRHLNNNNNVCLYNNNNNNNE